MTEFTTCLMFVGDQHGRAEEAIELYVSLFADSRVLEIERYGPDEEEPEGTVKQARFTLAGEEFRALESGRDHQFTFTPAISLFVDCAQEDELDRVYEQLTDGGAVLMPLQEYPFSPRFAWVQDRFGVTWQLNLAAPR